MKVRHDTRPQARRYNPDAPRTGPGVYDLTDLRARCHVDADSGCWLWRLTLGATQVPRVGIPPGVCFNAEKIGSTSGPRLAWLMAGRSLTNGRMVWRTCRHPACLNPEHLKAGTKKQHGQWMADQGEWRGNPKRAVVNAINRSVQLVPEATVRHIEQSIRAGRLHCDISAETGVHKATISKISQGRHLHQRGKAVYGSSVFNLVRAA